MHTFLEWLQLKSQQFTHNSYLIDSERTVTYGENFRKIQLVMNRLAKDISPGSHVVFIGASSIEAYQLYFAVIALQAIWIPFDYLLQQKNFSQILSQINPSLIIYDRETLDFRQDDSEVKYPAIEMAEVFSTLNPDNITIDLQELQTDRLICGYLTSGSTGEPKIVMHSWYETWYHAEATVERYQLTSTKRLFNPRLLCHVSGAFPLTVFMHCGGSIVIPSKDSYRKSVQEERVSDWAHTMHAISNITHASFFPSEMYAYAALIDQCPQLKPLALERITTGGEGIELSQLIHTARAFSTHKSWYDYLWWSYPLLGDTWSFNFCKAFYEFCFGRLVQITQTYGATELICNAVANSPVSGPDTRGIGTALNSLSPQLINEQGQILPWDGRAIGRLRFFGSSIAHGYFNRQAENLQEHYFQTNDLASIQPNGNITLFGRTENLIILDGEQNKINPVVIEREINKNCNRRCMVSEHNNKLHVAIEGCPKTRQQVIIAAIKNNKELFLVATISFWTSFPLLLGGKVDREAIKTAIKQDTIPLIELNRQQEESMHENYFCPIL